MKHPNQATLALHAGGDLGPWPAGWTGRHLARCAECREEVARFEECRQMLPIWPRRRGGALEPAGGGDESQYPAGPGGGRVRAAGEAAGWRAHGVWSRGAGRRGAGKRW